MRLTVILILLVLLIAHQWALVWALERLERKLGERPSVEGNNAAL